MSLNGDETVESGVCVLNDPIVDLEKRHLNRIDLKDLLEPFERCRAGGVV